MIVYLQSDSTIIGDMEFNNMKEGDQNYEDLKNFGSLYVFKVNSINNFYFLKVNEVVTKFTWRSKVNIVINVDDYKDGGDLRILKCDGFIVRSEEFVNFLVKRIPSKIEKLIKENLFKD